MKKKNFWKGIVRVMVPFVLVSFLFAPFFQSCQKEEVKTPVADKPMDKAARLDSLRSAQLKSFVSEEEVIYTELCNGDEIQTDIAQFDRDYYSFFGIAGQTATIRIIRMDCELDPAFYLFFGTVSTTAEWGDLEEISWGDDELDPPAECEGGDCVFYGDPELEIELPYTGMYTLEVAGYLWCIADGPFYYNLTISGISPCNSGDDSDYDGIENDVDNCPEVYNPIQEDYDADGIGDVCDDSDGDGITDDNDNCPGVANPNQGDYDSDDIGDVCDDSDGDGITDDIDNCPDLANPNQEDYDSNGIGDVCDDSDRDGCLNSEDGVRFSNMEEFVVIDGCSNGVQNKMTSECGVMMSDAIDVLEAGDYKNSGQFVKVVTQLTKNWMDEGLITQDEQTLLLACAGQSSIGSKK